MSFVYIDTSVALAHLLAENQAPPERFWDETLISSRLLEYELWNRIHARKLSRSHSDAARELVGRIALIELISPVTDRARDPFPVAVRTLDGLHLSSILFLRDAGQTVSLATYDANMAKAGRALGISEYEL